MQDTVINYAFLCSCLQLSSRSCFRFADNLNSICSVISMDDGTVDKSTQEPKINCGCFHFKNDEYECFVAYSRCSPFVDLPEISSVSYYTTGNCRFAECQVLCRVFSIGHSANKLFGEC